MSWYRDGHTYKGWIMAALVLQRPALGVIGTKYDNEAFV